MQQTLPNTPSEVLDLTMELIRRPSVTPADEGCQQLMADRLVAQGFAIESMFFEDTLNLWARRGQGKPLFCFAGHTDVVPTGPLAQWQSHPFTPEIRDGFLYGRGAADMKGSLAAMIIATERFLAKYPDPAFDMAYLITSDEEGPFINGTKRVVEVLEARQEKIRWCLVGEPSSTQQVGDVIKNGRRGSLTGYLKVLGTQGHVAYPHLVDNPIHRAAPALAALSSKIWDHGNAYFPATSFQISNIHAGTGATNVVPGEIEITFNFRYSTEVTAEELQQAVIAILEQHHLKFELNWVLNGLPFLTESGALVAAVVAAVSEIQGLTPSLETSGGTSDGRFIAPTGAQVLELGPCNASIHKIDEHVRVADLDTLVSIYELMLEKLHHSQS